MQGLTTIEGWTMTQHAEICDLRLFNSSGLTRDIQPLSMLPTRRDIAGLMAIDISFDVPHSARSVWCGNVRDIMLRATR